jgi:arsenite methyltransferase
MTQSEKDEERIREAVRSRYTELAKKDASEQADRPDTMCNCGGLYSESELAFLPTEASSVSAGCGNPGAIAALEPGMTVVDLGSGGGIDVFLAARKVGPGGRVIGIDATPEMIYRARRTARENGFDNAEFRLGEIEQMPVETGTVDVVISNCVINLSPDKGRVFREAFRILRPGGRLAVSDIVLMKPLPESIREDMSAWSSCVSGAMPEADYLAEMERAGFERVEVVDRAVYGKEMLASYLSCDCCGDAKTFDAGLDGIVASAKVVAHKPQGRGT